MGIDGAILVFNEESSITLAEGATLTAFDNVSMEFILDADSITGSGAAYTFDVFAGIDNLTDEGSLAIIEEFEQAVAAGEIGITFKTAEGEQIELDTASTNVSFTNGTFSILTASVPEPTTATLSLLALAGLAARRRRKLIVFFIKLKTKPLLPNGAAAFCYLKQHPDGYLMLAVCCYKNRHIPRK